MGVKKARLMQTLKEQSEPQLEAGMFHMVSQEQSGTV